MSSDRVIEVKNLEKIYRSGTHAVKGISFEVNKGEIFGILGPHKSISKIPTFLPRC